MNNTNLGTKIKRAFYEMPAEFFEPMTFNELEVGDKYIAMPYPGDNDGHGGFRQEHYIFEKIKPVPHQTSDLKDNSLRLRDGVLSHIPDSMYVIKVE